MTSVDAATVARDALLEQVGPDVVGDPLGTQDEPRLGAERVTTYSFVCTQPGYRGWRWAVTVVELDDVDDRAAPTVDEVVLLPGADAIVAPPWVPYRERIRPGDLSPGDLLPTDEDDPRLVPGWLAGDPEPQDELETHQVRAVVAEVGLGRARVLSLEGREQAAQRWYDGDAGPQVPLAQSAPARCGSCGFLVRLAGPLSTMFGVCANAFANDDGKVVALDHGCGAHSEAQLRRKQLPPPLPEPILDSMTPEDLERF